MGCCCTKSEDVQEDEGERTPLLGEKHLTADSVTGGDTPSKTDVIQDAEPEEDSQSKNEAWDSKIPHDVTPSPVDLKRIQIPEHDEKMEAAVLRYHNHLDHYCELQKIVNRIQEMYNEHNKDQSIVSCFARVCKILGTRFGDVLWLNETDPTCIQLTYDKELITEEVLPAVDAFNKASRLVKDLLHEDPLLALAIDDVIFAENVTRAEIAKMSKEKDPSVVNQCLDHYLYDIRRFYYIKKMLEKIKDETHSIHSQLQEAAQEIKTRLRADDSVMVTDDLVKLENNGPQKTERVSEAELRSTRTSDADLKVGGEEVADELEQTPDVSATKQTPDVSATEQTPDVSATEQTPDVSATEQTPDVSATEQTPDVSATEQTPDVSAAEQTPDVSAAEQTPDVSATEQTPDVSAAEQTPDVSAAEQTPDVSAAEQTPDVSAAEQTPDVSAAEQTPDVSAAEQTPDVSAAGQTPDVSAAGQTPDVSAAGQTPDVSAAGQTSDVSTSKTTSDVPIIEGSLDASASDHTQDVTQENLCPVDSSMDQRTVDTTLDNTADISADFRTDESASFITDEGEVSYTSNEELDATRESLTESRSFTEQ